MSGRACLSTSSLAESPGLVKQGIDMSGGLSSKPVGILVLARKAGKRVTEADPWVLTEPGAPCGQC